MLEMSVLQHLDARRESGDRVGQGFDRRVHRWAPLVDAVDHVENDVELLADGLQIRLRHGDPRIQSRRLLALRQIDAENQGIDRI